MLPFRSTFSALGVTIAAIAFSPVLPAIAAPTAASENPLAQLYVGDTPMMTTYGIGNATAAAETAEITFAFGTMNPLSTEMPTTITPLTEPMLQPFVEAVEALGISAENVDVDIQPITPGGYYPGQVMGQLFVTLDNPSLGDIDGVKQAIEEAAENAENVYLYNSYDSCSIEDFTMLEDEARTNAIADARSRIEAMAAAVNGRVGNVLSTIEVHGYRPVSTNCTPPLELEGVSSATPEVSVELGVMMTFGLLQ